MGNHEVLCSFCHEDTRGLMGVKGCTTMQQASICSEFKKQNVDWYKVAEKLENLVRMAKKRISELEMQVEILNNELDEQKRYEHTR